MVSEGPHELEKVEAALFWEAIFVNVALRRRP